MKRKWAAVLATVFAAILVLQTVPAAAADGDSVSDYGKNAQYTMYVSVSGSDQTGNGTQASPWKTISHALSMSKTGDTVCLCAGTYDIAEPIELPPGVSLEGTGEETVLTSSTLTAEMGGQNGTAYGSHQGAKSDSDGNSDDGIHAGAGEDELQNIAVALIAVLHRKPDGGGERALP